jgi:predicted XRE-type DNA-binding protein
MKTYNYAFGLLTDNKTIIQNYKLRSRMMDKIMDSIRSKNWTQKQAAENLGVSQTQINDLQTGRMSKFSSDLLTAMVDKLILIEESKS